MGQGQGAQSGGQFGPGNTGNTYQTPTPGWVGSVGTGNTYQAPGGRRGPGRAGGRRGGGRGRFRPQNRPAPQGGADWMNNNLGNFPSGQPLYSSGAGGGHILNRPGSRFVPGSVGDPTEYATSLIDATSLMGGPSAPGGFGSPAPWATRPRDVPGGWASTPLAGGGSLSHPAGWNTSGGAAPAPWATRPPVNMPQPSPYYGVRNDNFIGMDDVNRSLRYSPQRRILGNLGNTPETQGAGLGFAGQLLGDENMDGLVGLDDLNQSLRTQARLDSMVGGSMLDRLGTVTPPRPTYNPPASGSLPTWIGNQGGGRLPPPGPSPVAQQLGLGLGSNPSGAGGGYLSGYTPPTLSGMNPVGEGAIFGGM